MSYFEFYLRAYRLKRHRSFLRYCGLLLQNYFCPKRERRKERLASKRKYIYVDREKYGRKVRETYRLRESLERDLKRTFNSCAAVFRRRLPPLKKSKYKRPKRERRKGRLTSKRKIRKTHRLRESLERDLKRTFKNCAAVFRRRLPPLKKSKYKRPKRERRKGRLTSKRKIRKTHRLRESLERDLKRTFKNCAAVFRRRLPPLKKSRYYAMEEPFIKRFIQEIAREKEENLKEELDLELVLF